MESHFDVTQSQNNFETVNFDTQNTPTTEVDFQDTLSNENNPLSRKEQALKIDTFIQTHYDITAHNFDEVRPNKEVKPHKAVFILLGDRHGDDTVSRTNAMTVKLFQQLPSKDQNQSSLSKVFTEGGKLEGHESSQARYIDEGIEIQDWDTYQDDLLPTVASLRRQVLETAELQMESNMDFIENNIHQSKIIDLTPHIDNTNSTLKLCYQMDKEFHTALEKAGEGRNIFLGKNVTQSWQQDQRKVIVIAGCYHLTLDDENNPIKNILIKTGQPYIVLTPKGTHEKLQTDIQELLNKEEQKKSELKPLSKQEQLDVLKERMRTGIEKVKTMPTELVTDTGLKMMEVENVLRDQSKYLSIAKQIKREALYQDFETTNQSLQSLWGVDGKQNDEQT